jgi:uncharacterized protein (DUF58 family)
MRLHLAGRARAAPAAGSAAGAQHGVRVDAATLAALEPQARDFNLGPRQPVHSLLAGRHASRVRGRGLDFEELRPYLPGDDIRAMDWRVTARTGRPHLRVYTEEKDRPVQLVVDQRMNMFFGTRRALKSVAAAEVAALVAWRCLAEGDRVGGLVFGDEEMTQLRPRRSRDAVLRLLGEVARHNGALRADRPGSPGAAAQLDLALRRLAVAVPHDQLVVLVSDFAGLGATTRDLLLQLAARNDVLAILVHDPFLSALPASGELVVSDGELQVELGFARDAVRGGIARFIASHRSALEDWRERVGVPVLPVSTAEEAAPQLRRLLGQLAAADLPVAAP